MLYEYRAPLAQRAIDDTVAGDGGTSVTLVALPGRDYGVGGERRHFHTVVDEWGGMRRHRGGDGKDRERWRTL